MHESGPDADPKEKGKVFRVKLFRQTVRCSQQDSYRSSNAHNNKWLSRKKGINDSNNGTAQECFRGGQVFLSFAIHEFGKNECGDELNDKGEKGGIHYCIDALRTTPIALVEGNAGLKVFLDSRHELKERRILFQFL